LECEENQLTSLDLSKNTKLTYLICNWNQLTTLNISANVDLGYIELAFMPSLFKICIWTMPFPPAGVAIYTTDSPNVLFSTDCSK
jgi:hypothetical protein